MILAPRFIPRLASTVGLFTNYGLRDFAKKQGLLDVQGISLVTDGTIRMYRTTFATKRTTAASFRLRRG